MIEISNIKFNSPIIAASGTFGYGDEVESLVDLEKLGCVITKSITLKEKIGNPHPRIIESSAGMLNAIGLSNVGVENFCKKKLSSLNNIKTNFLISIAGTKIEDYVKIIERIEQSSSNHIGYEVNISCPNVKKGGLVFGVSHGMTEQLTIAIRKCTKKLVIMKLSPNVTCIEDIAMAAENGGADAVSAINTLVGLGIDAKTRKMKLHNIYGGLSGPAIKPIALANVHKIFKSIKIPIIGLGGIQSVDDIVEFFLAGAHLVQIGTLNYRDPSTGVRLALELKKYCLEKKLSSIHDIKGLVEYR